MPKSETYVARPRVVGLDDGAPLDFAGVRGRLKLDGADTGERFATAHFPFIPAHALAAPLHRHHNEDEYVYVLDGILSVQLGDDIVTAEPGTWIIKPRGQWHTFWNAADTPCRTLEIVSPAGFQRYFAEVATLGGDMSRISELNIKYSLDMDFESIPILCQRFGLSFPAAGQP